MGRGDLIRKIRIPRWMIVFSSSISATINVLLSLVVVAIFIVVNQVPLSASVLWLPAYLVMIYLLALGCSLFLAAAYVKFRDLSYIWEIILQAGFYATPIIYPLQMVNNELVEKILLLNPMAMAIQGARYDVVTHEALTTYNAWDGAWYIFIPFIITVVILIGGLLYFKSQSKDFAENI